MEKKVLLKELVDSGTNIRRNFIPKAVVSTEGEYQIGEFWDANKTIDVIVNNSHKQHDNIRELDEYVHSQVQRLDNIKVGRISAQNVLNLTESQINNLKVGDTIMKQIDGVGHAYTVAYKSANEMSIVYTDHETVEEVYYEKVNGVWTYIQTDTFKPEDYYTKTEIDDKLDDVLGINASDIASIKSIVEDLDDTTGLLSTINSKQETLVSGQNIKTVDGKSILGTGNIAFPVIPTNISSFTNDTGYLTEHQSLTNYYTKDEVDALIAQAIADALASLNDSNEEPTEPEEPSEPENT